MPVRNFSFPNLKNNPGFYLKVVTILWAFLFIYFFCLAQITGPLYDDWNNMYFLKQLVAGEVDSTILFERFYGAHTVTISRLLFAMEYFLFDGTNIFPKIFALSTIGLTFLLFYKNIKALSIPETHKTILLFLGFFTVFGTSQLFTLNYTWFCFQHPGAILFSFLAIHVFSSDIRNETPINTDRILIYLALGAIACLFTAVGFFGIGAIFCGLVIQKAPRRSIALYFILSLILAYVFRPDDIIIRATESTNITASMDMLTFLNRAGANPLPFFPHFFVYLFGYTGAFVNLFSSKTSVFMGAILFSILIWLSIQILRRNKKDFIFFQLTLLALLGHAVFSAIGRYQSDDIQFDRYATIYPWLIWSGCILGLVLYPKMAKLLFLFLLTTLVFNAYPNIIRQLKLKQDCLQADINMINNSFIHMTYVKIPYPLKIFNFRPEYFHEFQKSRNWGIYRFPFKPDLSRLSNDQCDAIKFHEFTVSEKNFSEYKLDGWNTTQNKPINYLYALDQNNTIVAYGISMARQPSMLPLFMLSRKDVMLYIVIPKQYPLTSLRLVGGDAGGYCEINMGKKII